MLAMSMHIPPLMILLCANPLLVFGLLEATSCGLGSRESSKVYVLRLLNFHMMFSYWSSITSKSMAMKKLIELK